MGPWMRGRILCVSLCVGGGLVPGGLPRAVAGQRADEPVVLCEAAAGLPLIYGKRTTDGSSVEARLSIPVRRALNEWAALSSALGLTVLVPETADALLVGIGGDRPLEQAGRVADQVAELFADLLGQRVSAATHTAVVVFLFDEEGLSAPSWGKTLDALVARNILVPAAAEHLRQEPAGLTQRERGVILQPTFDSVGDAAAGDDEFRLENEIAHKFAVCLLRQHFGEVPAMLRWSFGYVAEQRVCHSTYQFDRVGFVAASEHVEWPARAQEALGKLLAADKGRQSTPAWQRALLDEGAAGTSCSPQLVAWATLDYLLEREPEALASLLSELGALDEGARRGRAGPGYAGDPVQTEALLAAALADVGPKALLKHLKQLK